MITRSSAIRRVHGLAVALWVISLTACSSSVALPGTVWRVSSIEGADDASVGQTIAFPDAGSVHLTWACGESRASATLDERTGSLTLGSFDAVWEFVGCPLGIGGNQSAVFDALPAVTGWRVISPDVVELTGGPLIRLERLPETEMHRIGVQVVGPGEGWPNQWLVLRIGQQSWAVEPGSGGGVAWPFINREVSVTVIRATDCMVLTTFHPPLDTQWQIQFSSETDTTLTELTDGAMQLGPPLGEISPAPCPYP